MINERILKLFQRKEEKIIQVYNQIIYHPFIQQMINGTLDRWRFTYYMENNIPYLEIYSKCSNLINQSINQKYKAYFKEYTDYCGDYTNHMNQILTENSGYITGHRIQALEEYTKHLIHCCIHKQVGVAIAAFLPCEWVFMELGKHFNTNSNSKSSYKFWFEPLIEQEYIQRVDSLIDIFYEFTEEASFVIKNEMLEAFYKSTILELDFFNDSYNKQVFIPLHVPIKVD